MRTTRKALATAAASAAVGLLVLTGCGSDDEGEKVPETATGSLEHLADEVGCAPNMQTDADEIRQAVCKKSDVGGKFILATFATDRGQREWLDGAKDYGGFYLVGRKWVAVAEQKTVRALRTTLGGDMEIGTDHSGGHSGGSGSAHPGHSG
jgi:hypothetical protein